MVLPSITQPFSLTSLEEPAFWEELWSLALAFELELVLVALEQLLELELVLVLVQVLVPSLALA